MDERQLISQIISGSESAFRILMGKYERLVSHMVVRAVREDMDREELCQDVFVKVYEKLHTFNFESKLSTWIATIAYRTAVNFAKKKKMELVDIDAVKIKSPEDSSGYENKDLSSFVLMMIEYLPVNYKLVLTLFYLEGFSYPEIVEVTGMPEGTVKNYLHRAKNKLRDIVIEHTKKEVELI